MKRVTLSLPSMYADHHVLRVRQLLSEIEGVESIAASAGAKVVTVEFDDALSADDIGARLAEAGYAPNQEPPMVEVPLAIKDGSSWYTIVDRTTVTNMKDLAAAGDVRSY